jgi:hypothetical protein
LKFLRYTDVDEYKADVLDILLEDEVLNNLQISILIDGKKDSSVEWLMSTVTDDQNNIALIALCTKPFNLLLYKPKGGHNDAFELLARELKRIDFAPSGVLAESRIARSFSDVYRTGKNSRLRMSMILMRLDKLVKYNEAPGFCRALTEDDLLYTPKWEQAFCIDCHLPVYTLSENEERIRTRIGKDTHFIWEDNRPVSQAVNGRNTPTNAVINWVYTPPELRGRGYATSVVAKLSETLLERGKTSCCLFADAENPTSRSIYKKLGYYDICRFDEILFDIV